MTQFSYRSFTINNIHQWLINPIKFLVGKNENSTNHAFPKDISYVYEIVSSHKLKTGS